MRGSALTLANSLAGLEGWQPDLILATDMVDLAQFRSFARPFVGDVPTALYFHESQLTYPAPTGSEPDLSYALTNWLSAYSADHVFFNSLFHRDVFFASLPRLLRNFPDLTHEHLIDESPPAVMSSPSASTFPGSGSAPHRRAHPESCGTIAGTTTRTPTPSPMPSDC